MVPNSVKAHACLSLPNVHLQRRPREPDVSTVAGTSARLSVPSGRGGAVRGGSPAVRHRGGRRRGRGSGDGGGGRRRRRRRGGGAGRGPFRRGAAGSSRPSARARDRRPGQASARVVSRVFRGPDVGDSIICAGPPKPSCVDAGQSTLWVVVRTRKRLASRVDSRRQRCNARSGLKGHPGVGAVPWRRGCP